MISIIICSVNRELREKIKLNIAETIGVDFEIIIIENEVYKYPIAKAYNIGAAKARFPYLCFSHEDIAFRTPLWGDILIKDFLKSNARLIGVLGCAVKVKTPSSVYLAQSDLNYVNHLQRHPDKPTTLFYENPDNKELAEVCLLDGLFIASTKKAWEETKFSEEYLTGFHGYDIDYSIKNALLGKVIVSFNFLLEHFSYGAFNSKWVDTQLLVSKIWEKQLPLKSNPSIPESSVEKAELLNLKEFIKVLLDVDYKPSIQFKFVYKHFLKSPLEKVNLYYLRRIILRNRLNKAIKSLVKSKG